MSATTDITTFAQSVYLVIKNRYYDDIEGTDGQTFILQVMDWTNMFIDELESVQNTDGQPIDWNWSRQLGYTLGTATAGEASIDTPSEINNLIVEENRYVQILQDTTVISNWAVVEPSEISSLTDRITEDMVARVGDTIVFSRAFRDSEDGGTIIGDVTLPLPRMAANNSSVLRTVKPKQLLILGVAKNATLPDIVQGGLSPSYTQKFNDLLQGAIARNGVTSLADTVKRDNLGYIGGVGF